MSCWGSENELSSEQEPLLAQYDDETVLLRAAHEKMHSYLMIKALFSGYMPSTEQIILNMRTILASEFLSPDITGTSDSSKQFFEQIRQWVTELIQLVRNKNDEDQIQDLIYFLSNAEISVDTGDLVQKFSNTKTKTNILAVHESIKTIGSLLFSNSDFKIFLGDLAIVGRQIISETSLKFSEAAQEAARGIDPSSGSGKSLKTLERNVKSSRIKNDIASSIEDVGDIFKTSAKKTFVGARESTKDNLSGDQRKILTNRLCMAVTKLRKRNDYSKSVNVIGLLIRRYGQLYSQDNEPEFENVITKLSRVIEQIFTEPDFFDSEDNNLNIMKIIRENFGTNSSDCIMNDTDMSQLLRTSESIWSLVFSTDSFINPELLTDIYTFVIPHFIQALQYIPFPRLEISVPEIDLLVENLILEPGNTVNHSFLPSVFNIQSFNDLTLHRARSQTISDVTSIVTIKLKGLSLRADEVGYWFRIHMYLFRFSDEGIASIEMDERGLERYPR